MSDVDGTRSEAEGVSADGGAGSPRVAVITPTYNRANLIADAVESVLAQTLDAPIEMAIVDDGSTDETEAVLKPYLEKHGVGAGREAESGVRKAREAASGVTITYTRLEKQGVVAARNTAIANTTAPFIAFLDSDDYWLPDKLEKQLALMDADANVGVVHTSFRYVNEQGEYTDAGPQRLDNPCVGDCLDVLLNEFLVLFSSVMVRRDVVERAAAAEAHGQPFDARWINAQDYDLMLRAARLCEFAYVPQPLVAYRVHGAHGAMGNLKRAFGFHCRVQLDFVKRYGDEIGVSDEEIRRRVVEFLAGRAESMFWQRRFDQARDLCELARELEVYNERFAAIEKKASRPAWVYKAKDTMDRLLGRR